MFVGGFVDGVAFFVETMSRFDVESARSNIGWGVLVVFVWARCKPFC